MAQLHLMYTRFLDDMAGAEIGEEQKNVLLNGLASITECVYPIQFNANPRVITEAEKSLLEVCATVLPKEGVLDHDDLKDIRASINTLREQVENARTSPILTSILLELIRLSEDSINRFNIHGARGLSKAFKGMLAEVAELYLVIDEEEQEKIKKSPAWSSIVSHLRKFDSIAGKLLKYRPLLEKAAKLLLE